MPKGFEKILKKATRGDRKSQVVLYEEYYGYAMSVALRFCDSREESKEIVHDSFLKAFTKLESVANANSFKPWFRRIIVNTSIDVFRKKKHEVGQLDVIETDATDYSENAIEQLSAQEILDTVQQLSPMYRLVFTLFAIEGYKHEEISEKLGISVGTSKSNLFKARIKLQKMLSPEERISASNG